MSQKSLNLVVPSFSSFAQLCRIVKLVREKSQKERERAREKTLKKEGLYERKLMKELQSDDRVYTLMSKTAFSTLVC